jgi:hypothetical protein
MAAQGQSWDWVCGLADSHTTRISQREESQGPDKGQLPTLMFFILKSHVFLEEEAKRALK